MKTNNLKKILSIVIVSIVLALVAVTVVLAVVPKALYNPLNKDFQDMTVYRNGAENIYITNRSDEETKIIEDIISLHEKSLKDSILSNLLQGTGKFDYDEMVKAKGQTGVKTLLDVDGTYAIEFSFHEKQTLKINGEEYKDDTTFSSKTVSYDKMFLVVKDTEKYDKTIIYLTNGDNTDSSYYLEFLTHQSELYDYITELEMPVVSK